MHIKTDAENIPFHYQITCEISKPVDMKPLGPHPTINTTTPQCSHKYGAEFELLVWARLQNNLSGFENNLTGFENNQTRFENDLPALKTV